MTGGWPFTRRELVAGLLVFLLTLPFVTARIYASDEVQYFAWLRSWAFDRDVDFENEYQHFHDAGVERDMPFHETFLVRRNEAGRRENYGPVGSAILWAPSYAVGHVAAVQLGNQGADGRTDLLGVLGRRDLTGADRPDRLIGDRQPSRHA